MSVNSETKRSLSDRVVVTVGVRVVVSIFRSKITNFTNKMTKHTVITKLIRVITSNVFRLHRSLYILKQRETSTNVINIVLIYRGSLKRMTVIF